MSRILAACMALGVLLLGACGDSSQSGGAALDEPDIDSIYRTSAAGSREGPPLGSLLVAADDPIQVMYTWSEGGVQVGHVAWRQLHDQVRVDLVLDSAKIGWVTTLKLDASVGSVDGIDCSWGHAETFEVACPPQLFQPVLSLMTNSLRVRTRVRTDAVIGDIDVNCYALSASSRACIDPTRSTLAAFSGVRQGSDVEVELRVDGKLDLPLEETQLGAPATGNNDRASMRFPSLNYWPN